MTFSYDEDDDVLYVTFAQPKNGVRYVETDRGDVLRFCESTNQIVGVTIMFFADRTRRGEVIDVFSAGMHTLIGHGKPHAKQA
jgi:uncharacterized protein YuzE